MNFSPTISANHQIGFLSLPYLKNNGYSVHEFESLQNLRLLQSNQPLSIPFEQLMHSNSLQSSQSIDFSINLSLSTNFRNQQARIPSHSSIFETINNTSYYNNLRSIDFIPMPPQAAFISQQLNESNGLISPIQNPVQEVPHFSNSFDNLNLKLSLEEKPFHSYNNSYDQKQKVNSISTVLEKCNLSDSGQRKSQNSDSFSTFKKNEGDKDSSDNKSRKGYNLIKPDFLKQKLTCSFKNLSISDSSQIIIESRIGQVNNLVPIIFEQESKQSLLEQKLFDKLDMNCQEKSNNLFQKNQSINSKPETARSNVIHSPPKSNTIFTSNSQQRLIKNNRKKSFFLISNYKKKLLASLNPVDQKIISNMKQCKKFNFSKNVIKQFHKVVESQIEYLYEKSYSSEDHEKEGINFSFIKNSNPLVSKLQELRSSLNEYLMKCSFTHATIKKIMVHPLFSQYFKDFLEHYSNQWIDSGKTKYKEEQIIMIDFLKLCQKNQRLLSFLSHHDPYSK